MITLKIPDRKNRISIIGASEKALKMIDEVTSFEIEGSYFMKVRSKRWDWDGKQHLLSAITHSCPVGLLNRIEKLLQEKKLEYEIVDERKRLDKSPTVVANFLEGITLAPHQLLAINNALAYGGGILHVATNGGKSACCAAIIKVLISQALPSGGSSIALVVVPTRVLVKQTQRFLASYLGIPLETIGQIGNGKLEPKQITVATASSLNPRKAQREDPFVFKAKTQKLNEYLQTVMVLVLDECHHSAATTWYSKLSRSRASYRFGMSGTPLNRTDGKSILVEAVCGHVIATVKNDELIEKGWSAKPTINLIDLPGPVIAARFWQEAYKLGIVENDVRNEIIVQKTLSYVRKGLPCLILCREIAHIRTLRFMLKAYGLKPAIAHGQMKTELAEKMMERFESGSRDVLIVSPMLGEGVDFKGDRVRVLVNAEGLKSPIRTLQKIGRGLRKKEGDNRLLVLEFNDKFNHYLGNHSKERLKTYRSEGFEIKESFRPRTGVAA